MTVKPTYEELLELLDNTSASLESTLLAHGRDMTPSDRKSRGNLVHEARQLCDRLLRGE